MDALAALQQVDNETWWPGIGAAGVKAKSSRFRGWLRPVTRDVTLLHPHSETGMKVGVLQFFGWRDRSVPLRQIYDMALERIVVMDTTG